MKDDLLEASIEELYEQGPCGFLLTSMDGTLLRVNDTLLGWTGHSRDVLVGHCRFQDLLTIAGKIFYENQLFPLLRLQGDVREVALDLTRQDGAPLPVLVNGMVRAGHNGQPSIIAYAIFDATDRRVYERELLESQRRAEQLAAVVRMSSDAIVSMLPDGTLETWNDGAARLFGYASRDILGRNLRSIVPDLRDDECWTALMAELRQGRPVQQDMTATRADGICVDVSAAFTPHWTLLGDVDVVSVILRDISQRRAIERLQQEFLAVATHELRSPVASIKGNAQLMQRRTAYSERSVEAIIAQADKLQRLVDDLLLASQIQADRFAIDPVDTDLVELVRSAVEFMGTGESPIQVDTPSEHLHVFADPHRLNQVLTNLLTNAIKYSPPGSEVKVSVRRDEASVRFSVMDHGIGIPPESLPLLFRRFYRVPGSAQQASGLGLGLFISHRIVEAHGGQIDVESEPGRGSTFTVSLPPF